MITATRLGKTTSMRLPSGRTVKCKAADPSTCGQTDRKTGRTHASLWNNPFDFETATRGQLPAYDKEAADRQELLLQELALDELD